MCTHNQCFEQKQEKYNKIYLKIIIFTTMKNCSILHGCFVMNTAEMRMAYSVDPNH